MIEARIGLEPSVTEFKRPANLGADEFINRELLEVSLLQEEFETALNIAHDPQDLLRRSYNPVFDRWHVEKLRGEGNENGLTEFKSELRENLRTNLMERLHAVESYGEFEILDGELCRDGVPFRETIKRGVEYRASLGSPEQEREGVLGELGGWDYINKITTDPKAKVGTTVSSFSPHGLAQGTSFDGWFVDKYIVSEREDGTKYVKRIRIGVDWDYPEYEERAKSIKPDFFDEYDGRPKDAWFLSHPFVTEADVFQKGQMELPTEILQAIISHPSIQRLEDRYEAVLFSEEIDFVQLALSLNALLNCADDLRTEFMRTETTDKYSLINEISSMTDLDFGAMIYKMGTRKVQAVGGGGCPTNKGINMTGLFGASVSGIDSNSVAQFGIDIGESGECKCIDKSDNHYHCPGCEKRYDDETNLEPEKRTKECGCGFEFGC